MNTNEQIKDLQTEITISSKKITATTEAQLLYLEKFIEQEHTYWIIPKPDYFKIENGCLYLFFTFKIADNGFPLDETVRKILIQKLSQIVNRYFSTDIFCIE